MTLNFLQELDVYAASIKHDSVIEDFGETSYAVFFRQGEKGGSLFSLDREEIIMRPVRLPKEFDYESNLSELFLSKVKIHLDSESELEIKLKLAKRFIKLVNELKTYETKDYRTLKLSYLEEFEKILKDLN